MKGAYENSGLPPDSVVLYVYPTREGLLAKVWDEGPGPSPGASSVDMEALCADDPSVRALIVIVTSYTMTFHIPSSVLVSDALRRRSLSYSRPQKVRIWI